LNIKWVQRIISQSSDLAKFLCGLCWARFIYHVTFECRLKGFNLLDASIGLFVHNGAPLNGRIDLSLSALALSYRNGCDFFDPRGLILNFAIIIVNMGSYIRIDLQLLIKAASVDFFRDELELCLGGCWCFS
jgi:hypothetical protein